MSVMFAHIGKFLPLNAVGRVRPKGPVEEGVTWAATPPEAPVSGCLQREGSRRPGFGRIFSWYRRSDVHTREEAVMAKIRVYTTPT